jgi:hypothetical protein
MVLPESPFSSLNPSGEGVEENSRGLSIHLKRQAMERHTRGGRPSPAEQEILNGLFLRLSIIICA